MGRSHDQLLESIAHRAYLVDPVATDADLMEMGKRNLATELRHDHRQGRIAENHAHLTGKRVLVIDDRELQEPARQTTMAGAVMSPSTK